MFAHFIYCICYKQSGTDVRQLLLCQHITFHMSSFWRRHTFAGKILSHYLVIISLAYFLQNVYIRNIYIHIQVQTYVLFVRHPFHCDIPEANVQSKCAARGLYHQIRFVGWAGSWWDKISAVLPHQHRQKRDTCQHNWIVGHLCQIYSVQRDLRLAFCFIWKCQVKWKLRVCV